MGGERGWAAAELNFSLAAMMEEALDDGDTRKRRRPNSRTAASTILMGLVRRIDLDRAMMEQGPLLARAGSYNHRL